MKRLIPISISGLCILFGMGGCGTSADGPSPESSLAQGKARELSDAPLVVPSDTELATEKKSTGTAAGQVDAAFNVTADGEATYTVPLWVPPGRAGMQPKLSLSYRSRGGNGMLGVGWNVSGLSQIARCRKTFAQDGLTAPIRFTQDDAFCMDGQRLVVVATATDTIEYRTEVESFTKVIAYLDDAGVPDYFEAYLKDGRILSYGRYEDTHSRLEGLRAKPVADATTGAVEPGHEAAPVRLSWGLSEVRDRAGNDMRIHYRLEGDHTSGYEHLPDRIDYSGHTSDTSGELRRRSVRFVYTGPLRQDSSVRYVAGLKLRSTQRLYRLEMYGPGLASTPTTRDDVRLRYYELTYRNDTITRRSLVKSLSECDGAGVCRDSVDFSYDSGFDCSANPDNDCSDPVVQASDFTSMAAVELSGSNPVPIRDVQSWGPPDASWNGEPIPGIQDFWTLHTLDINGDGRDDLLYRKNDEARIVYPSNEPAQPKAGPGIWYFRLATGSPGLFGPATLAGLPKSKTGNSDDDLRIVDMDGDGTSEVVALIEPDTLTGQSGYFQLYRFNGTSFVSANIQDHEPQVFWWDTSASSREAGRFPVMHISDLNGDGLPELFRSIRQDSTFDWGYRMNQGGLTLGQYVGLPLQSSIDHSGYAVDVDGDGSTEILVRGAGPGAIDHASAQHIAVGVGPGSAERHWTTTLSAVPIGSSVSRKHYARTWFLDINADGLADAVSVRRDRDTDAGKSYGDLSIAINTGNGFLPPVFQNLDPLHEVSPSWIRDTSRGLDPGVRVLDFDHDGRQDLLLTDSGLSNGRGVLREKMWVLLARDDHFEPRELTVPVGQRTGGTSSDKPYGYGQRFSQVFDFNGDGLSDIVQVEKDPSVPVSQRENHGVLRLYLRKGREPDVLTGVLAGKHGKAVTVRYQHLQEAPAASGQPRIYTQGTCSYPQQCVASGQWVVVESGVDDGTGTSHFNTSFYSYEAGRVDLKGRGWLGFGKRTVHDTQTGATVVTTYNNQARNGTLYLRASAPVQEMTEVTLASGVTHRHVKDYDYVDTASATGRPFLYAVTVTESFYEGTGATLTLTRSGYRVQFQDTYGNTYNSEQASLEVVNGATTGRVWSNRTEVPQFDNREATWLIGLPLRLEDSSTTFDGLTARRVQTHEYDPVTGLLGTTVVEPGSGIHFELTTVLTRNSYGLVERVDRTGEGPVRSEFTWYDDTEHQFPVKSLNAGAHRNRFAYHPGFGTVAVAEDANGLVTRFRYDGLARQRATVTPTGEDTTLEYGADSLGQAKVTTRKVGGQEEAVTLDNYGRERRSELRGFDGSIVSVTSTYDNLGRKTAASRPTSGNAPPRSTSMTYDKLGRVLTVTTPEGTVTSYGYDKLTTTKFDERSNKTSTNVDGLSQVVARSQYTTGGRELRTTYAYGPFGLLRRVTDSKGNVVDIEHDRLGRRTRVSDPDSGVTTSVYNAFGELKQETDGGNRVTTYEYDALGRQEKLTGPDGVTTLVWDTDLRGALWQTTSPQGVTTEFLYNDKAQLSDSTWRQGNTSYTISQTYDWAGRLETMSYPEALGRRMKVRRAYTDHGYLREVRDDVTQHVFWTAQERNAFGQLTSELLGNGVQTQYRHDSRGRLRFIDSSRSGVSLQKLAYEWDVEGNLLSRNDVLARTTEDFEYDPLDRLKKWTVFQNCRRSVLEYDYDDIGNLLARRVLEGSGSPTNSVYTGAPGGPHAVKQTQAGSYGYDGSGNQVSGPGRAVSYTAFDLPLRIAGAGREVNFTYDARQARFRKSSSLGGTTIYVGGVYEQRQAGGQTQHVFYISGAERVVAQVVWAESAGSITSEQPLYLLVDHQGSTETVTDLLGGVVGQERMKFEPFGARRLPYALPVAAAVSSPQVKKGFTGHEPDDEFGLVNMRGRVYDPETARFLTPDPFVQMPEDGQSYNRYAYALNNPLRWTDPTGFQTEGSDAPSEPGFFEEVMEIIGDPPVDASPVALYGTSLILSADQNGKATKMDRHISDIIQMKGNTRRFGEGRQPRRPLTTYFGTDYDLWSARVEELRKMSGELLVAGLEFVAFDLATRGTLKAAGWGVRAAIVDGAAALKLGVAEGASALRLASGGCFVAGTPVLVGLGVKPIEQVSVGDWVWAWDEETREPGWHQVSRTFIKPRRVVLQLELASSDGTQEVLRVTPEHPFWVKSRGWTQAQHLEPGDALETATFRALHVRSLQQGAGFETVYNFEVERAHTYFVGQATAWVHNQSIGGPLKPGGTVIGLGVEDDLAAHWFSGATTYKDGAWQRAGLTRVSWAKASMDEMAFMRSFQEAAQNAAAIRFEVTRFSVPGFYGAQCRSVTSRELIYIIDNGLLPKASFWRGETELYWATPGFGIK
ncbi:RHS repeat-associated core domain-containing protein [Pyxidicoccus sp. MSG2]|uniref:RHS repeat-associated core domain-containing protein n=1 Tax=Pyxidicoccus sp. MSG2 TaxID=2996790 RepID=UPI002270852A|nr:RHS repeat-associated core domain-containing protein [Pyxidicoccus sp. MSG2]MCY1015228.1 FG-GAP-like repeat-containing protein [Pyxidicoccus sp. MSG2]